MQHVDTKMFGQWKDNIYESHRKRCAGQYPIGECWPPSPAGLLAKIKSQVDPFQLRTLDMEIVIEPMKPWVFVTREKGSY